MLTDRLHPSAQSCQGGFRRGLTLLAVLSGTLNWGLFSYSLENSLPVSSGPKGAGFLGVERRNEVRPLLSPSVFSDTPGCTGHPQVQTLCSSPPSPREEASGLQWGGGGQLLGTQGLSSSGSGFWLILLVAPLPHPQKSGGRGAGLESHMGVVSWLACS